MRKLPVIIAAASALCVFPALAAPPETGSQPPFGMQRDLGGTKGSLEERRSYGSEREGYLRERGARGQFMQEGCKYITIRQRQGDTITIRRFKRCD
jgi:hypothetical protein